MRGPLLLAVFLLLPALAAAQIGLYVEPDVNITCNAVDGNQHNDVYLIVTGEWRTARFSIPQDYQCVIAFQLDPLNGTAVSGDFDQGFELRFPACTTDHQVVARLDVMGIGQPCCEFGLAPHPSATTGQVELTDCSGHTVAATWTPKIFLDDWLNHGGCADVARISPPPRNPFPADGAVDAPVSMLLWWELDKPIGGCATLGVRFSSLYLGTSDPPPLITACGFEGTSFQVGPLAPGTTYYWKLRINNYDVLTESPVWSFRTLAPVSVETTTWGRVKALYKN